MSLVDMLLNKLLVTIKNLAGKYWSTGRAEGGPLQRPQDVP